MLGNFKHCSQFLETGVEECGQEAGHQVMLQEKPAAACMGSKPTPCLCFGTSKILSGRNICLTHQPASHQPRMRSTSDWPHRRLPLREKGEAKRKGWRAPSSPVGCCVSPARSSNAAYVVGEGRYYSYASYQGCYARQTLLNSNSFCFLLHSR